ncbi:MAG: N-ethylammeline chlorohydrolase [Firmicutes bacterium HGW-Firmicutes-14]|nr:MAG: N-ethylammeline chlorohydrolase [Firmicutes bacterium HGW-Firmicutes-14]
MSKTVIKNAAVIPMTRAGDLLADGEIMIEGSRIVSVGPRGTAPDGWGETIDAAGMVAMPGFINCHTHTAMTLLRSYADDLPLMEWLEKRIWPLEERLTGEDVYWGTMLCILEMIKSGTTTFADMYFFMDDVARAVEESGIRACLSRGMIGSGPTAQLALDETREFIGRWNGAANGRITTMAGPHAPYTCPPDYLKKVLDIADEHGVGIHIHLAETRTEVDDIMKQYGKSPVEYLRDAGLLEYPVLAAHCVHLNQEDIKIIKEKRVGVAHNPESNMKLASGIAPVPQLLAEGVSVGLGTDGAASNNNLDMMEEMRTAALLHKVHTEDPTAIPSYQALEMATKNGGKVLGIPDIGVIEPGYRADIVLLDFNKPHLYPKHDLVAHTVYAAQSSDVDTVIIDGNIIMSHGKVLTMNEAEILENVQRCASRLVKEK